MAKLAHPGRMTPETQERAAKVVELHTAGWTFVQIARELGYSDHSGPRRAWERALKRIPQRAVEAERQVWEIRFEALLRSMWPKAIEGSTWHVDRCLAISDRLRAMKGADAPQRIEQTNYDGDSSLDNEIAGLLEEMGTLGQGEAPMEAPGQADPTAPT